MKPEYLLFLESLPGNGFQHSMDDGPFQFHFHALCYDCLGQRIHPRIPTPCSVLHCIMMWKYVNIWGALGTGRGFFISHFPYLLIMAVIQQRSDCRISGGIILYSILRYRKRANRYLYLLKIATVSILQPKRFFFYTAQGASSLAFLILSNVIRDVVIAQLLQHFITLVGIAVLLTCLAIAAP
jgi:hypothetical protein